MICQLARKCTHAMERASGQLNKGLSKSAQPRCVTVISSNMTTHHSPTHSPRLSCSNPTSSQARMYLSYKEAGNSPMHNLSTHSPCSAQGDRPCGWRPWQRACERGRMSPLCPLCQRWAYLHTANQKNECTKALCSACGLKEMNVLKKVRKSVE